MYFKSTLFRTQIVVQILLTVLVCWFSLGLQFQSIFCGVLLCVVGIPHGANDHLYRKDKSIAGMIKFLGIYLGSMALYLGLWYAAPLVAFILFFAMSFHHFGQSNFENESITYLPSWLMGVWLLAFPFLLHTEEAVNIFQQMLSINGQHYLGIPFENIIMHEATRYASMILLAVVYLISLFRYERENFAYYCIQFIAISLWYLCTPLLFGFIVVFCLWHSLQSLRHQFIFFQQTASGTLSNFIKGMVPFSLLALISFGIYVYVRGFEIAEASILLSIITLPHVAVMHKLYKKVTFSSNAEVFVDNTI
jgi:beta-carotene 15,15'-dioxygenase